MHWIKAQQKLRDTDFAEMSGFNGRKRGKGRDQQRGPTRLGNSPTHMIVFCAMFTLLPPGSASKTFNNCSMRGFNHFHVCGIVLFSMIIPEGYSFGNMQGDNKLCLGSYRLSMSHLCGG